MKTATAAGRLPLYFATNALFIVAAGIAFAVGGSPNPRLLYVVLLFGICSIPILNITKLNDRYALLGIFLTAYFAFFGATDFVALVTGQPSGTSTGAISSAEAVILAGAVMLVIGYLASVRIGARKQSTVTTKEWPTAAIVTVGLLVWLAGTAAMWIWNVYIVVAPTAEATRLGLASVGAYTAAVLILGQMIQPLGVQILAYAHVINRSPLLAGIFLAVVLFQVFMGFVFDAKGLTMIAAVLLIITTILVRGKLPLLWIAAAALFVVLAFPVLQAYRSVVHQSDRSSRAQTAQHLGEAIEKSLQNTDKVNTGRDRAQTFIERTGVKHSVEIIVDGTAAGVAFQRGATFAPIVAAFVPRVFWPDKPNVETGKLIVKEFHISDSEDLNYSPTHIGELYWNFGWPGVLIGMTVIGCLFGVVGARTSMLEVKSVTRLLVAMVTIKLLILEFEGVFAAAYVVWLRSLAAIAILHAIFARNPASAKFEAAFHGGVRPPAPSVPPIRQKWYPNLLH